MFDSVLFKTLLLYVPISIVGLWRWTYWMIRKLAAKLYVPATGEWPKKTPKPTVSIVTPVYNEDPEIFEQAMRSWIANGVDEIIAVIDKSNTRHITDFERRFVTNKKLKTNCRLMVTPKPGKRAALCDGIAAAKGDLIVLVDSDTIWGENLIKNTLPHFLDKQVGGATVTQRIHKPKGTADIMFDILLWTRYREEVPFLLGVGKVFNTLSGRTAFYRREAVFNPHFDNLHALRHEHFLGTRGISGDDKRLTHLILQQGWHVSYVPNATVYTPGLGKMKRFLKQRLRWTRNSWRADLRATGQGWVWNHPALALFMVDRFIQPFFMLIGPVAFVIALTKQEWIFVGVLLVWWLVSRFIRLFAYFKQYPARLIYLPAYILYTYVNAVLKVYAFATLIEHSWATRWHKQRLRKGMVRKLATVGGGLAIVAVFLFGLSQFVVYSRNQSGYELPASTPEDVSRFVSTLQMTTASPSKPVEPGSFVPPTDILRYVVKEGDTLAILAEEFKMDTTELKKLNGIRDPDKISVGQELYYYPPKTEGARQ